MRSLILVCCLTGCATVPQDDGLVDVALTPTAEEIARQNEQEITAAKRAQEWQDYACAQPLEEQKALLEQLKRTQGWTIVCPKTSASGQADAAGHPQVSRSAGSENPH